MDTDSVILGEVDTIKAVLSGKSLARYGDGELKIMQGSGYSREPANALLTAALLQSFMHPHHECLIGIPTWDKRGPKYENWMRHRERFRSLMNQRVYASAFVTRPDSAPWINTTEYAQLVEKIWKGRRAVVLCESGGSMIRTVERSASEAIHVVAPHERAFAQIHKLEDRVLKQGADVAIVCCGPTASILAHRLAPQVQAVDLGSAGQFLGRLLA